MRQWRHIDIEDMNVGVEMIVYIAYAGIIVFIFLLANFLAFSAKSIGRLLFALIGGAIVVAAANLLFGAAGVDIPINPFTSLCAGVLGIPGLILMAFLV